MPAFSRLRASALSATILGSLAILPRPAPAQQWFPFDMAVEELYVLDEKGFRADAYVEVPEGTVLQIYCKWSVVPTGATQVNPPGLMWQNVVEVDGGTRGLFPIEVPPNFYGKTSTQSGGVLGLGGSTRTRTGVQRLEGSFDTGWRALGSGDHKLGCVLDSNEHNLDLETNRGNNRREMTVRVTAASQPAPSAPSVPTVSDAASGRSGQTAAAASPQLPAGAPRTRDTPAAAAPTAPAAGRASVPGRPAQLVLEGEDLVTQIASIAQGQAVVQPMQGFGAQWSGNRQLFWGGGAVGAALDLNVNVAEPGVYAIVLRMTRAPDYADVQFAVDAQTSAVTFPGYAAQVTTADVPIGSYTLSAGPHRIGIMIRGKQAQSTNYFVGLDRITMTMIAR